MSMASTGDKYVSIYCLFLDTLCKHVHDVDMNERTQAAVKLDQANPACRRHAERGRQVEANLKELGYGT